MLTHRFKCLLLNVSFNCLLCFLDLWKLESLSLPSVVLFVQEDASLTFDMTLRNVRPGNISIPRGFKDKPLFLIQVNRIVLNALKYCQ